MMLPPRPPSGRLLRADQDHAEAAAAGCDVDEDFLIGLVPSRGAYLLSSSSTMIRRGSRARPLLLLEDPEQKGADDEPLSAVVKRVDIDDRNDISSSPKPCATPQARRGDPSADDWAYSRRRNAIIVPAGRLPSNPGRGWSG